MANPSNLAAALQYKQRQEQLARADQQLEGLFNRAPTAEPKLSTRQSLENLSMGLGSGLESQLEGTYQLATKPIQSAKAMYQGAKEAFKNPSMIADALKYVGKQAASGPLGFGEVAGEFISPRSLMPKPMMQEMTTYHGTPHRFPATEANPLGEFDASKIGTGEGAQAFGEGSYLSESKGIGKRYQESLGHKGALDLEYESRKRGIPLSREAQTEFYRQARTNYLPEEAAKNVQNANIEARSLNESKLAELVKDYRESNKGSLYAVDLPDDLIAKMLDYDKPINKQSKYVRGALEAAGINSKSTALAGPMAKGQESRLQKYGIPGIRYLDSLSEDAGKGTSNFVVFPGEEKKLKILERN